MSKTKSRIRRLIWSVASLAIVAAAALVMLRPQPILVDTDTVSNGRLQVTIDEDGVTRIRERYVVSTPLSGRLVRIQFDVGDTVEAHETILARMEPTDPSLLDPRILAQSKARVKAAERKLDVAKSDFKKSETTLSFAEIEMGRARELRSQNATSQREFEEKQLLFEQFKEAARSAELAVEIAQYELELQQAALLLTDPDVSDDQEMELAIRAPIDGRILRIYQESSAVLNAGAQLMQLGDPSDLEIVADVLSRDAVRISPGDDVILEHWGGDLPLKGRVRLVEPSGFTKLSALGVEEQRVNVIIDLVDSQPDIQSLGDSFRIDCRIIIWQDENALRVPTSALFRVEEAWHVFQVDEGKTRLTKVEIGKDNGRYASVESGLASGATVVIHPSDVLEEGSLVKQR